MARRGAQIGNVPAVWTGFRSSLVGIGLFSSAINLLTLTGSVFMLQVYDRVLPSRSVPTFIALQCWLRGCSRPRAFLI